MTAEIIIGALSKLDPSDPTQWTQQGLPTLEIVRELTGIQDLKRAQITDAAPSFTRETLLGKVGPIESVENTDSTVEPSQEEVSEEIEKEAVIYAEAIDLDELQVLEDQIAEIAGKILNLESSIQELNSKRNELQVLQDSLISKREKSFSQHSNQLTITAYLQSQQALREQRSSGQRSLLDNSFASRRAVRPIIAG